MDFERLTAFAEVSKAPDIAVVDEAQQRWKIFLRLGLDRRRDSSVFLILPWYGDHDSAWKLQQI